jgi:Na+/phosphate symporter
MSDTLAAIQDGGSSTPKSIPFVLGAVLGGTTLSLLSAAGTFALEKQQPTVKTLSRDFILGAILFLMIMQLLPESTGNLVSYAISFISIPAIFSAAKNVMPEAIPEVKDVIDAITDEIEVKVGVPRF